MRKTPTVVFLILSAGLVACTAPEADAPDPVEAPATPTEARTLLSEEYLAVLDSGSAAYRAEDFGGALAIYTRATELNQNVAAGWFGVFMCQEALGNSAAAAEALDRARKLDAGVSPLGAGPDSTS